MRFERLIWTSVINLHRSQHLIYSFFIRHHNLTVTSGTSFIPIESFNPFEYIDLHPGERGRETCTSTRHRGTKEEFWIRVFRPFNTYGITDTDKLITIKRIHRLFKLSKFRNNVWRIQEWDIYMNTRFAREHVVSDRCTATKWHCFWTCDWQFLSACAQEHHIPPTCLPTSLLAASSASFARPNPHSTPVLPPLLRVSLSRSRPSLVFSVLHHNFSSPIFHRSSFYPCFSRSPTFNTKYLTVIYIFLRYSISFNFFLLFQLLN